MLKRTATYHEFLDERGTRYVVRLCHGLAAGVVQMGPAVERIEWRREWGRFSPLCESTAARLVEEFDRRQALRRGQERINAELLVAARETRPARSPRTFDDAQLPVGDRA